MRYQRKKKRISTPLAFLILLTISLTIYIVAINTPDKQPERPFKADTEYKTYEYVIEHVEGSEVYGKALTDDTGIFFDLKEIKSPIAATIIEGSKIKVWMEAENHIEGIERVEVIE